MDKLRLGESSGDAGALRRGDYEDTNERPISAPGPLNRGKTSAPVRIPTEGDDGADASDAQQVNANHFLHLHPHVEPPAAPVEAD